MTHRGGHNRSSTYPLEYAHTDKLDAEETSLSPSPSPSPPPSSFPFCNFRPLGTFNPHSKWARDRTEHDRQVTTRNASDRLPALVPLDPEAEKIHLGSATPEMSDAISPRANMDSPGMGEYARDRQAVRLPMEGLHDF
jgi:hypothetical protein